MRVANRMRTSLVKYILQVALTQTLHREQEFDHMANLTAEAGHDRLLHDAGIDAEPIPELEFDQTFGW